MYNQKSGAGLYTTKESKQGFPLNYLFGIYREEGKNLAREWIHPTFMVFPPKSKHKEAFKWHLIFMLIPLNSGTEQIQQALFLREPTSYFDGMQGYLLTPIVE